MALLPSIARESIGFSFIPQFLCLFQVHYRLKVEIIENLKKFRPSGPRVLPMRKDLVDCGHGTMTDDPGPQLPPLMYALAWPNWTAIGRPVPFVFVFHWVALVGGQQQNATKNAPNGKHRSSICHCPASWTWRSLLFPRHPHSARLRVRIVIPFGNALASSRNK